MKVELWFNRESATDQALIADAGGGGKKTEQQNSGNTKETKFLEFQGRMYNSKVLNFLEKKLSIILKA
jgi:hypothetical protein